MSRAKDRTLSAASRLKAKDTRARLLRLDRSRPARAPSGNHARPHLSLRAGAEPDRRPCDTGFLTLQQIIKSHEASSSIINASARQRALVQEVATAARHLVASQDPSARAADRAAVFEAAHSIEEAHQRLTDSDHPLGQPLRSSEQVRALYFAEPLNIDRQIRSFVEHALRLSGTHDHQLGPDHPSLRYVTSAASGGLLISLDALVDQLEQDGTASVRRSRTLETGVFVMTLLLLSLEALFIFRRSFAGSGARARSSSSRRTSWSSWLTTTR
jgi:hypothetical protein